MTENQGALSGVTVLDLCDEKGQLMGKLLGEMGARVIKIEPPDGDGARTVGPFRDDNPDSEQSLYFWAYNTAKEGITLDIETESGQRILKQLAAKADVLMESFDAGYMDSLGLGYGDLSAFNPSLIVTSLTGFGQDGPYRDYKTSDIVALAVGGVMNSCGYDDVPGSPPIRPSGGHGYMIGAHFGAIGTLLAINWRDMTGEGQHVDASIHEACSGTTEAAMPQYMYMQQQVRRQTGRHHGASPTPKTLCPTSDGRFINVFAMFTNVNSWRSLVGWMDSAGMAEDLTNEKYRDIAAMRMRAGPEVDHAFDVLRRFIRAHTAEEIYRGSQERKFPWGIVRTPDENLGDAHLEARDFFEEVEHPELKQSFVYPGRPYVFSKTPWSTHRAPLLGEHNDKVYRHDLDMSQEALAALKADGTI
ncbi:MAG TPA: carnitine dehydratase [Dehalococcoidia bacterium]|nr:carnitine dehydratase [Dehalococcoidia bacterium]|tara:strand:+ start:4191 stop:5441 length:1251 start_codon:yes stop_codon:yes gene_type:complete